MAVYFYRLGCTYRLDFLGIYHLEVFFLLHSTLYLISLLGDILENILLNYKHEDEEVLAGRIMVFYLYFYIFIYK